MNQSVLIAEHRSCVYTSVSKKQEATVYTGRYYATSHCGVDSTKTLYAKSMV